MKMTRRELMALMASAPLLRAKDAPTAPVSIARCRSYDGDLTGELSTIPPTDVDQRGAPERARNAWTFGSIPPVPTNTAPTGCGAPPRERAGASARRRNPRSDGLGRRIIIVYLPLDE